MNSSNVYHVKCLVPNKHMKDFFFFSPFALKSLQAISGTCSAWVYNTKKIFKKVVMKSGRTDWLSDLSACSVKNANRKEVFA